MYMKRKKSTVDWISCSANGTGIAENNKWSCHQHVYKSDIDTTLAKLCWYMWILFLNPSLTRRLGLLRLRLVLVHSQHRFDDVCWPISLFFLICKVSSHLIWLTCNTFLQSSAKYLTAIVHCYSTYFFLVRVKNC